MANTVQVTGIAKDTPEKEVRDFFSFCGKIQSLNINEGGAGDRSAEVTFEKETAAKTALLLDNTQLGTAQVHVTSNASAEHSTGAKSAVTSPHDDSSEEIRQEDKPRSRIIAEYLAHGYVISDHVIERALATDQQHGISQRLQKALTDFDSKLGATEKAQAVDQKLGVTNMATASWQGLNSYFEKAIETPTGQKLRRFYDQGQKQVIDVHNEARHLADLKAGKSDMGIHPVGQGKTACNCQGKDGQCPCESGKCACNGCGKNEAEQKTATA